MWKEDNKTRSNPEENTKKAVDASPKATSKEQNIENNPRLNQKTENEKRSQKAS
jgi:hypothetical protein